jgi:hypothetical protein
MQKEEKEKKIEKALEVDRTSLKKILFHEK